MQKKPYETPRLTIHGDVQTVTQNCGEAANADTPRGRDGSACLPGSM